MHRLLCSRLCRDSLRVSAVLRGFPVLNFSQSSLTFRHLFTKVSTKSEKLRSTRELLFLLENVNVSSCVSCNLETLAMFSKRRI